MALHMKLGGIRRQETFFTTVVPVSTLVNLTIPDDAFQSATTDESDEGLLDPRLRELRDAHAAIDSDPRSLVSNVEDQPFTIYFPERLTEDHQAQGPTYIGGELCIYGIDAEKKALEISGAARLRRIRQALSFGSDMSGSQIEQLRSSLVSVNVIHGADSAWLGQALAGGPRTWESAAKEIFGALRMPLASAGRQVSSEDRAKHKHLLVGHAVTMVRGLALGSLSKAVSNSPYADILGDQTTYDQLVQAGVTWFGVVLDHFESETMPDGTRNANVFSDTGRVVRALPIKVALGVMGHSWLNVDLSKQVAHTAVLSEVNWEVSPAWQGIAGKVTPKLGRPTTGSPDSSESEFTLAAAGAKELGSAAVRALMVPASKEWVSVRQR